MTHRTKERPGNQRRMSKEIELTTCRMAKPGSGEGGGAVAGSPLFNSMALVSRSLLHSGCSPVLPQGWGRWKGRKVGELASPCGFQKQGPTGHMNSGSR